MLEESLNLPITTGPKGKPRTWLVADGKHENLRTEEFRAAVERARHELERCGVRLKGFPHDWGLPEDH